MSHPLNQFDSAHQAIVFTSPYLGYRCKHRLKQPNLLLSLHGRSMLQRVIGQLMIYGCRKLLVMLGDDALLIKDFLQDGSRWGCQIQYHYIDGTETLGQCMRRIGVRANRSYWLADASCLPSETLLLNSHDSLAGDIVCWREREQSHWAAWGVFAGYWLLTQPHPSQLEQHILQDKQLRRHWQTKPAQVYQLSDVLQYAHGLLATQVESVVQGHGCQIHPTARLIGPVCLGDQVKIGPNVVLGPYAMIESGAMIEQETHIHHSLVCRDTYIGHALDIQHSIVQGSLLANIPLATLSEIADVHLLASLTDNKHQLGRFERLGVTVLRVLLHPLYRAIQRSLNGRGAGSMVTTCPRPAFAEPGCVEVALSLPRMDDVADDYYLHHFCEFFYPGLAEISRGKLALLGPQLRDWQQVRQLPQLWRQLYGEYRCGLLNETMLVAHELDMDAQFANDAFAAANQQDQVLQFQLLQRYLQQVWQQFVVYRQTMSVRHAI